MSEIVNLGKVSMTTGGEYNPSQSYDKLTCVHYDYCSWVSKKPVPEGVVPSMANSAYWQKISDRGERGPQGQSYVDKEMVPIVDDLTTGGSENVLSAEQGKVLDEKVTELVQDIQNSIGYNVPFEQGAINYLTGVDSEDDKCIRTTYIQCTKDIALRFQFGKVVTHGYIIKYLGTTYVGYSTFSIGDNIKSIDISSDVTFDKIRIRIASGADWTDVEIRASNVEVCDPDSICDKVEKNIKELKRVDKNANVLATPNVNIYTRVINSCIKALYLPYLEGGYRISVLRRNDSGVWSVRIYTANLANLFNFTWNSSPEDANGMTFASVKDSSNVIGTAYIVIDWKETSVGTSYSSLTDDSYLVSDVCYDRNTFDATSIMQNTYLANEANSNIINYQNEIGRYIFFEKGSINYLDGTESDSERIVRSDYIDFGSTSKLLISSKKWFSAIRIICYKGGITTPVSSTSYLLSSGRLIEVSKDNTFDKIRIRIDATTDWTTDEVSSTNICVYCSPSVNDISENDIKSNLYPDPHFVLPQYNGMNGIWVDYYNPQLTQIKDGCVFAASSSPSAKGMYIEMRMTPQWLIEHGFTDGQTFTIGAEVRADVGASANITAYRFNMREESVSTEKSVVFTSEQRYVPTASNANNWQKIMTKVAVKNISTAYKYYYVTLAYMQLTDSGATELSPDILYVRKPWIAIGDKVFEFSESVEALTNKVINTINTNTEQLCMTNAQVEANNLFSMEVQKNTTRWLELSDNFTFPSQGVFIGRVGNDVYVSINGVLTKLNN